MQTNNVHYSTFSGWIDPPADVLPGLTADIICDVAVIGGGLGGMSTALRLADRGRDVVLIEAEFCGHGSSSRNAGQLVAAPGGDLQLLNLFERKKMPGMVRLAEHAAYHVEGSSRRTTSIATMNRRATCSRLFRVASSAESAEWQDPSACRRPR